MRRGVRDGFYPTNPPAHNDKRQTQEWTTCCPLSSLQQATPFLPRTVVSRYSSLISCAWAGQCYLSSVIYWRNIGSARGPHLPSSSASSVPTSRTHLHSLPDSNHPAAATPTEYQPATGTWLNLLLPGRWSHLDLECLKFIPRTGFKASLHLPLSPHGW